MHWAAGLADVLHGDGLIQVTRSVCGPIAGLAIVNSTYSRQWAATCIQFNKSALQYITTSDSIKTVVLSSVWTQYMEATSFLVGETVERTNVETLRMRLLETISALRIAGKHVILIAPPPRPGSHINVGECLERRAQGLVVFLSGRSDCAFTYGSYYAASHDTIDFLNKIERLDGIDIIWPESITCDNQICAAQIGKTLLYRDEGHLTYEGSVLLARMLHMADKLENH